MEINFKFEIGQMVIEKSMLALREGEMAFFYNSQTVQDLNKRIGFPPALKVFERQMIECYNATQLIYNCRSLSIGHVSDKIHRFTEPELEAFDYIEWADKLLKERNEADLFKKNSKSNL